MSKTSLPPTVVGIFTKQAFNGDGSKSDGPLDTGGGGGDDGHMEARVAKLETTVEYVQRDIKELKDDVRAIRTDIHSIRTTDFRLFFGALIAAVLGLATIMAKGFHWL